MARILVVYGPNLNLLGEREPDVYGHETMEDISARLRDAATRDGVSLEVFHSNSEGAIIDRLHAARHEVDAVVLNAGALTHYSLALRDAIAGIRIPVVAVHMSNTAARGAFRRRDVLAPVCAGVITGFGTNSFLLGLRAAIDLVRR
ncbi:MAG TPA: type II 3-dehydroquinate dehydratase [bacterium]|nr:type II 3-dehydroquinate dehydratase [bacterium]